MNEEVEEMKQRSRTPLAPLAAAYSAVLTGAVVTITIVLAVGTTGVDRRDVERFLVLAAAAAVAQLFVVRMPRNQTYHTTVVFLLAAVLVLPPVLLPLVALVQHVPDWFKHRHRLRFSIFNTSNHALNMLAAAGIAAIVAGDVGRSDDVHWALAGAAAAATLVTLNHVLLALIIRLSQGYSFRDTRLFTVESIAADLVPAALGVALATFVLWAPWLVPTAIVPLYLIQRALVVLQKQLQAAPSV